MQFKKATNSRVCSERTEQNSCRYKNVSWQSKFLVQWIFKQSAKSLFNQSSQDKQTVCLHLLPLPPLLHPSPPAILLPAALLCLMHLTLKVSVCSLWREEKKTPTRWQKSGCFCTARSCWERFISCGGCGHSNNYWRTCEEQCTDITETIWALNYQIFAGFQSIPAVPIHGDFRCETIVAKPEVPAAR